MNHIKLLYLPYAGGTALLSRNWSKKLHENIKIVPVELAGRGLRYREPYYESIEQAVGDIYKKVDKHLQEPYAIYGHSFGGLLAYELYYKIVESGRRKPEHLFFSAIRPPINHASEKKLFSLNDTEFLNTVKAFGGMEDEILCNRELMELFLPVIRSDFKLYDSYEFRHRDEYITSNVTVLYSDDMDIEEVADWSELVHQKIQYHYLEGGHFFIKNHMNQVIQIINTTLIQQNRS